jgi:hypothetical protein
MEILPCDKLLAQRPRSRTGNFPVSSPGALPGNKLSLGLWLSCTKKKHGETLENPMTGCVLHVCLHVFLHEKKVSRKLGVNYIIWANVFARSARNQQHSGCK